ncbi:MAG: SDR family NAD(P)-dependent oxidoreductase [Bacilli bacterium]|jgi:NAD(P)-dependent dehydrogenase (short-subunit alcohol dehydrogenase family)|nr:SDR family NAD(P)-dependent oxidoreductase [Bacilli bacterium]
MEFRDKVVIITGAGGGIGREIAKKIASNGAKLTLVDISETNLRETASQLGLGEENYLIQVTDVSKEEQVKFYVDETIRKFGKVDVFINNAGVEGKVASIVETNASDLDFVLNVNVKGVYYGLKHVMPHMMSNKYGSIVNTASVAGFIGSPGLAPYIASKHAVLGLTKTAALEGAAFNIRVNAICPGPVDNRMMRSIEEGAAPGNGDAVKKNFEVSIPLGRYATNEECADLIYFLASDEAKYITGQAIRVDGGMGAK